MNYEPVMESIVLTYLFLELSDAKVINEDSAVSLLEEIAATLHELGTAETQAFLHYLERRSQIATTSEESQIIAGMAESLGLNTRE